jgi:methyl-accepting chemotaxis protein
VAGPIRISILAEADKATRSVKDFSSTVDTEMTSASRSMSRAERAADSMESGISRAGEGADAMATTSAQVAGGLGDLAGAMEATGVISEGTAMQMELAATGIMGITGASDLANAAFEKMPRLQKAIGVATKFMLGPFGIILLVVAAVAAIFVLLYKNNETFRNFVDTKLVPALKRLWQMFKTAIKPALDELWKTIQTSVLPALQQAWKIIQAKVVPVLQRMWQTFQTRILPVLVKVAAFILGKVVPALIIFYARYLSNVIKVVSRVVGSISGFVRAMVSLANGVRSRASQIAGFFSNMRSAISQRIGTIVGYFRAMPGRLIGALGNLGGRLVSAGRDLMRGFISGVQDYASRLVSSVTAPISDAIGKAKGLLGISSPSKVFAEIGKFSMQGYADGVDRYARTARGAVEGALDPRGLDLAAAGAGGASVNVTVNAPVGSNTADIGRELQKFLDAYFRSGGRRRAY